MSESRKLTASREAGLKPLRTARLFGRSVSAGEFLSTAGSAARVLGDVAIATGSLWCLPSRTFGMVEPMRGRDLCPQSHGMTLVHCLSDGGITFRRGRTRHDIPLIVVRDHITIRARRRGDDRAYLVSHTIQGDMQGPRQDVIAPHGAPEQRANHARA